MRREPDDLPDYESHHRYIVQKNGNGSSWNAIAQAILVSVFLGAGTAIWWLATENAKLEHRVTVLEYKCAERPLERGVP